MPTLTLHFPVWANSMKDGQSKRPFLTRIYFDIIGDQLTGFWKLKTLRFFEESFYYANLILFGKLTIIAAIGI